MGTVPDEFMEYYWGDDLSGTEQGAGGVGGLLAVSCDGEFYVPIYGGNGNIMGYVDDSGAFAVKFEYDPYGDVVSIEDDPLPAPLPSPDGSPVPIPVGRSGEDFSFGFSTKYHDREVGLIAYQLRSYSPCLGRWLNRDPIEEEGGVNLYNFVGNEAILRIDFLGERAKTLAEIQRQYRDIVAAGRKNGSNVAADNLEYFLSARGGIRTLDWNWVRSFSSVLEAEKKNRIRFEKKLKEWAQKLPENKFVDFYDYFDAMNTANVFSEMYYASGTFTVSSYGEFILRRQGCTVSICGNLDHIWHDDYDWHVGLTAFVPGFGNVEDADAQRLVDNKMASPFKMRSMWTQELRATYRIRKCWWDSAEFTWGEPTEGGAGIFKRNGRSTSPTASSYSKGGRKWR